MPQFCLERTFESLMIEAYQFGRMVVDDKVYTSDLIVLHDRIIKGWWRKEGHKLWPLDLEEALETDVDQLVVGTGDQGMMVVVDDTIELLEALGIALIVEPTGQAWQTYNRLAGPKVAGAFHLTC